MLRLGLRLTVAGGKEAITRLAMIAIAVAIGAALLLATLSGINALHAQDGRYAWLETAYVAETAPDSSIDPLWWLLSADHYDGELIGRVDVAAAGPNSPIPPGMSELPAPGEYVASPALIDLLADAPAEQLADRFPGTLTGTLGDDALPAPNSLLIVIGRTPAELAGEHEARQVTSISTTRPSDCERGCALGVGYSNDGMTLTLSVVVAALLFPVLIFIGGATRLSAARREQRFAAMRLVGATPRQITTVATVESSLAAIAGVVAGFGLFYALRPVIAKVPFTGDPFFTGDLAPSVTNIASVALGIPLGAAIAARLALRRVNISPLGVTRRVTPRSPRAWRLVPVVAGLAELGYLAYFSDIGERSNPTTQAYAYLAGILLVMGGLVIAGPWLTMVASRLVARRATRPASLIAGRRLADNPQAGFRAISGLVLALFVGSCAIGIITTVVANNSGRVGDPSTSKGTLIQQFDRRSGGGAVPLDATARSGLASIPGVDGVVELHLDPGAVEPVADPGPGGGPAEPPPLLVACAELATIDGFGRCPAGAEAVEIRPDYGGGVIDRQSTMADAVWPIADMTATEVADLPVATIVVGTDGEPAAVEQARTVLVLDPPRTNGPAIAFPPQTISELNAHNTQDLQNHRQLANVVILASLPIAGCSLAVSIAAGLADRKRPFSLLRLAGTPLRMLRNVVMLESALPLLFGAVLAIGTGLLTAFFFLRAQTEYTLVAPTASFYVLTVTGVLGALAVIGSTLPLLRRITGPEVARND
jgi:hypothetical protein